MAAAVHLVWDNRAGFAGSKVSRHQLDRASERLRQVYGELKAEPLSPRLEELLERLAQSQPGR